MLLNLICTYKILKHENKGEWASVCVSVSMSVSVCECVWVCVCVWVWVCGVNAG